MYFWDYLQDLSTFLLLEILSLYTPEHSRNSFTSKADFETPIH
jgi:hypothetical protein